MEPFLLIDWSGNVVLVRGLAAIVTPMRDTSSDARAAAQASPAEKKNEPDGSEVSTS